MGINSSTSAGANRGTETSSRWLPDSATATHNFKVTRFALLDGMGTGKCVTSSTFRVAGRVWNIRLYPDGWNQDRAGYVSVFLCLVDGATGVRAKYTLSLLDKPLHTFENIDDYWGSSKFVDKSKLQELLRLNDDCFTIRCALTVIGCYHSEDVNINIVKAPRSNMRKHFWHARFMPCHLGYCLSASRQAALSEHQANSPFEHMLEDGKGQLFRAHRCVLAARSPVFDAELFGPMKRNTAEHIHIHGMEPFVFESLLHFVYTDRVMVDKGRADKNILIQHLLVAADRYGLDSLKVMCEAELCSLVDVQTVGTALVLAEQHQCLHLKDACTTFIASSRDVLGAVLETDGFKHFIESCPFVMKDILDKIAKNYN